MANNKKKKIVKLQTDEFFYVGVREPVEIRRHVLEASRDAVRFLQQYERLKEIRKEKLESMGQLRTDMKELRSLVNRLRKMLPKTKLRIKMFEEHITEFHCTLCEGVFKNQAALDKHIAGHNKTKKVRKKKERAKPKTFSELDKLEDELSDIEGKLEHL